MKVGSLFSGIGGLDLGLERAGMRVVWQSEIDPYACRVLAKHWPDVPNLGDITTIDWSTVEPVDIICGGYPCQPFSLAGVRRGEDDPRHLWPHFADAIRVLRPRYALLENVPGHLSLGFGRVLGDLAELGYDADWDCIPAAYVGAPHLRYRVIIVARRHRTDAVPDADSGRFQISHQQDSDKIAGLQSSRRNDIGRLRADVADGAVISVDDSRHRLNEAATSCRVVALQVASRGSNRVSDRAGQWAVEPDVGRVAHGVPNRVDRLRCLGNAVVPQVAEYVGRRIVEADAGTRTGETDGP
jgi:DNA (cytosine-5)-methyltransferase 1